MLQLMVNPTAGGGRAARDAVQLEAHLRALGKTCELRISAGPGDLTRWARDLPPSSEAVIAVGGDGTVSEVISGLHANPQPRAFCAVPSGSGNDFAKALGWNSIEDTLQAITRDERERVDLVRVGSRIAAYGLGMGFDAEVAQDALGAPAWLRGLPRYLYSILRILPSLETPRLKLIADGVTVYEGKSVLAAAMNTPTAGGGFKLAPNADPHDGLLDIMVGGDLSRLETLLILPRVIAGTHVTHPKVRVFRAKHARFEWERPIHAHTDGEQLPLTDCFEVECLASALEIVKSAASH
jgi:diacylglycerol kinase (ATP)